MVEVGAGLRDNMSVVAPVIIQLPSQRTLNCRSHSLRSSAFFLLKASSMSSRSPSCVLEKGIIWRLMSLKYSRASSSLLVPKPCLGIRRGNHKDVSNRTDLEVFVFPLVRIRGLLKPQLVLRNGIEVDYLLSLPYLCRIHEPLLSEWLWWIRTRTTGVMNSTRNLSNFKSDGKKWSK